MRSRICAPVGAVELEQALEPLAALAGEQRHQPEQGQGRERGDGRGVDVLGDEQGHPGERGVDDVDPRLAELLAQRGAAGDAEAREGDREVERELGGEGGHEDARGRGARADPRDRPRGGRPDREPRVADRLDEPDGAHLAAQDVRDARERHRGEDRERHEARGSANTSGTNASCVGTVKPNGVSIRTRSAMTATSRQTTAGAIANEPGGAVRHRAATATAKPPPTSVSAKRSRCCGIRAASPKRRGQLFDRPSTAGLDVYLTPRATVDAPFRNPLFWPTGL